MNDGSNDANHPESIRLYPDYAARMRDALGCTSLIVTDPEPAAACALVARIARAAVAA